MESVSTRTAVVVLERCQSIDLGRTSAGNRNKNLKSKFCSICGSDVSHKVNPTMSSAQFGVFVRDILIPSRLQSSAQSFTKCLQQSKWICTICLKSLEQVDLITGEMAKLEKVLKQLVDLLRFKLAQHSLSTCEQTLDPNRDLEIDTCEPAHLPMGETRRSPVLNEAKEEDMEIESITSTSVEDTDLLLIDDDIKPIIVEDDIDLNRGGDQHDIAPAETSSDLLSAPETVLTQTQPEPPNGVQDVQDNGIAKSVQLSRPPPPNTMIRSTRQSKLRAEQVIRSLNTRDMDEGSDQEQEHDDYDNLSSAKSDDSDSDTESDISSQSPKSRNKNVARSGNFPCGKVFSTRHAETEHRRKVHKTKFAVGENVSGPRFHCSICDKGFLIQYRLTIHVRRFHKVGLKKRKPRSVACDTCQTVFPNRRSRYQHKTVDHDREMFRVRGNIFIGPLFHCSICEKGFIRRRALDLHIRDIHKPNGAKPEMDNHFCKDCNVGFSFKKSLRDHIKRVHRADQTLKCGRDNCKKTFYTQAKLDEHTEHFHPENEAEVDKTVCLICRHKFPNIRAKIDHITRAHPNPKKKFACSLCNGLEFTSKNCFTQHMRFVHEGEKPFLCSQCGQRFAQTAYQQHTKIVCNPDSEERERFRQQRTENQIKYRQKVRQKSIKCKICGTPFLGQRRLDIHMARFHKDGDGESGGSVSSDSE